MEKPNETSKNTNNNYEVTTPLIETAHDHMMDHAMDHSMENDNMDHNHHQMEYEIHEMEHSMDPMHHSMEHKMDPMHHSTEHKMESEGKIRAKSFRLPTLFERNFKKATSYYAYPIHK